MDKAIQNLVDVNIICNYNRFCNSYYWEELF